MPHIVCGTLPTSRMPLGVISCIYYMCLPSTVTVTALQVRIPMDGPLTAPDEALKECGKDIADAVNRGV